MGDSFLKLQAMCSFSQNVCIEVYGFFITRLTPYALLDLLIMTRRFDRLPTVGLEVAYCVATQDTPNVMVECCVGRVHEMLFERA